MKIAIYGQYYHDNSAENVKSLLELLEQNGATLYIKDEYLKLISEQIKLSKSYFTFHGHEDLTSDFDLFISIGGDGTILRSATYVRDLGIPILGVNTGRLGFLSTLQKDEIEQSIHYIINKEYKVEERTLLQIKAAGVVPELEEINFALNEIAVSRKNTTSMITVDTYLNGEYLTSYWADGLIVATPTGSTGYSLSCGGPLIMPSAKNLVLTPIAPHNLNARPLVISDTKEVKLKVFGREESFLVSLDSRIATIDNEMELTITKAPFTIHLVELYSESFLKTIRKKLLWGEDRRNQNNKNV